MATPDTKPKRRNNGIICLAIISLEMVAILFFLELRWMVLPVNITIAALLVTAIYQGWRQDIALCFALFYSWQLMTFWVWVPTDLAIAEVLILACTLYWLIKCPKIKSEDIGYNVGLAFYKGPKTPWIAKITSLFGLPVTSIAVIMNGKAIVPTGKGIIESRKAEALIYSKNWVVLNTGMKSTPRLQRYFNERIDMNIKGIGCVKAMKDIILELGIPLGLTPGDCMNNLMQWRCTQ